MTDVVLNGWDATGWFAWVIPSVIGVLALFVVGLFVAMMSKMHGDTGMGLMALSGVLGFVLVLGAMLSLTISGQDWDNNQQRLAMHEAGYDNATWDRNTGGWITSDQDGKFTRVVFIPLTGEHWQMAVLP